METEDMCKARVVELIDNTTIERSKLPPAGRAAHMTFPRPRRTRSRFHHHAKET